MRCHIIPVLFLPPIKRLQLLSFIQSAETCCFASSGKQGKVVNHHYTCLSYECENIFSWGTRPSPERPLYSTLAVASVPSNSVTWMTNFLADQL